MSIYDVLLEVVNHQRGKFRALPLPDAPGEKWTAQFLEWLCTCYVFPHVSWGYLLSSVVIIPPSQLCGKSKLKAD